MPKSPMILGNEIQTKSETWYIPVIEHKSLNVGVSPLYWLIIPFPAAWGTGIVKVIGL